MRFLNYLRPLRSGSEGLRFCGWGGKKIHRKIITLKKISSTHLKIICFDFILLVVIAPTLFIHLDLSVSLSSHLLNLISILLPPSLPHLPPYWCPHFNFRIAWSIFFPMVLDFVCKNEMSYAIAYLYLHISCNIAFTVSHCLIFREGINVKIFENLCSWKYFYFSHILK